MSKVKGTTATTCLGLNGTNLKKERVMKKLLLGLLIIALLIPACTAKTATPLPPGPTTTLRQPALTKSRIRSW